MQRFKNSTGFVNFLFLPLLCLAAPLEAGEAPEVGEEAFFAGLVAPLVLLDKRPAEQVLLEARQELEARFDALLEDPAAYREKVLQECSVFPEGRIYSFVIPAIAYAQLALLEPEKKAHAQAQIAKLVDLAIPMTVEEVQPPGASLLNLKDYAQQATFLGTLHMGLVTQALAGDGKRHQALREHLSQILLQAFEANADGESIRSYPDYSWHFDSLMAVTALTLEDPLRGDERGRRALERHLAWKAEKVTDSKTGLPEAHAGSVSRGCDLSMEVCLLAQVAPAEARKLYEPYVAKHWLDQGFLAGFSEWPKGMDRAGDFDSGPVVLGLGLTATGIGLAATRAVQDTVRLERLAQELKIVAPLKQLWSKMGGDSALPAWFQEYLPMDPQYFSGMLYGDAMVFYALTWTPLQPPLVPGSPGR